MSSMMNKAMSSMMNEDSIRRECILAGIGSGRRWISGDVRDPPAKATVIVWQYFCIRFFAAGLSLCSIGNSGCSGRH